jgi:hypothetical protein
VVLPQVLQVYTFFPLLFAGAAFFTGAFFTEGLLTIFFVAIGNLLLAGTKKFGFPVCYKCRMHAISEKAGQGKKNKSFYRQLENHVLFAAEFDQEKRHRKNTIMGVRIINSLYLRAVIAWYAVLAVMRRNCIFRADAMASSARIPIFLSS